MSSYRTSHVGDQHGVVYDEAHRNKADAHIWDAFLKRDLNSEFSKLKDNGANRYLDFACGTGRVLRLGAAHFDTAVGIDISEDMLVVARERIPGAQFICGDVTINPDLCESTFDCVTLFRFLLNAETELAEDVLEWLAARMPTGATLIGNNHMNRNSFRGLLSSLSNRFRGTKHNILSRQNVERLLLDSGFRVQRWSGYRVLPSIKGKPVFGRTLQLGLENIVTRLGMQRFGSEQLFVAERI